MVATGSSLVLTSCSAGDTQAIAFELGQLLLPGSVLWLSGDLGAGKTTFVQGLARGLGITEAVTSPTFSLIDQYSGGRLPLYHVDLYRLEPEQVPDLHLYAYWQGQDFQPGILAIEWAERLASLPPHLKICFQPLHSDQLDQDPRQIEFWISAEADPVYEAAIASMNRRAYAHPI
ncbi:MAG: tRNA (adenosine(37)-N6)-threonylcarbamoyltransferase complex ATPase subunit type 1 TsaE [Pseudanabaenaceae cyanobacterium bins.68]|nr:tRNA (adenosine(37)-N6)-threonylcarbamoyltransferase complex ATPase subunit type 1 TsaE [Pseudanabaenaceae cyanobacterium bins.68]